MKGGGEFVLDQAPRRPPGGIDPAPVGLGRDVGVPMRLANMAYEKLTEAMNRGWGTRNSTVGQLLQVEHAAASNRPSSTPDACRRSPTPTSRSKARQNIGILWSNDATFFVYAVLMYQFMEIDQASESPPGVP